jgi:hypothetical protein
VGNQALARGRPNMPTQKMLIEKMRSCLQALVSEFTHTAAAASAASTYEASKEKLRRGEAACRKEPPPRSPATSIHRLPAARSGSSNYLLFLPRTTRFYHP